MVMYRILLTNIGDFQRNRGIEMMIRALLEQFKIAQFYYHRLTMCRGYERLGLKGSWKCWGFDLALDMGGDTFTLYFGLRQFFRHWFHLFLLVLTGQRFGLFSQTLSRYNGIAWPFARFILQRASFISVRDLPSYYYLQRICARYRWTEPPIFFVPDIAFLFSSFPGPVSDYEGSSYHELILALLSNKRAVWNGDRKANWKFSLFTPGVDNGTLLDVNDFRHAAYCNLDLLVEALRGMIP